MFVFSSFLLAIVGTPRDKTILLFTNPNPDDKLTPNSSRSSPPNPSPDTAEIPESWPPQTWSEATAAIQGPRLHPPAPAHESPVGSATAKSTGLTPRGLTHSPKFFHFSLVPSDSGSGPQPN